MEYARHPERSIKHAVTIPFIFSVLLPTLLLDLWVELYHRICFPLYGLPLVPRDEFIRMDRQKLSYLVWYDKINCAYCGYVNGVFRYAATIAAKTETYWCGIKHKEGGRYVAPAHHEGFIAYGDKATYAAVLSGARNAEFPSEDPVVTKRLD